MPDDNSLQAELERLRAENEYLKKSKRGRSFIGASRPHPPDQGQTSEGGGPLELMIEALGLEIAAIKKKGGSSKTIDLVGGTFVAASNGSYIYRFPIAEEFRPPDAPIRVQFGRQEVDGSVMSVGEGVIVLAMEEDLGPRLPRVRLIMDDSFLVEKLRERLQQVKSGQESFNMAAALRILGSSPITTAKADVPKTIIDGGHPLNREQVDAVSILPLQ